MTQTPRRWSGSELPEELNAALSSADADSSEHAIERLRARLSDALGPAFGDTQPSAAAQPQPAARALQWLTPGKWLGIGALFAIG
jgi:sarcosine oxidase gamma subunit